jgi:hypothetical protein
MDGQEFLFAAGNCRNEMPFANFDGYRMSGEMLIFNLFDTIYHAIPIQAFGA